MKKLLLALALGVLLAGAGCISPASDQSADNQVQIGQWKTHDNSRYHFTVEYPADWQLGEAPTNNDGRSFASPDGQITCRAYGFMNAVIDDEGNPQTLEEFVAEQKLLPGIEVIADQATTLDGHLAWEIIAWATDDNTRQVQKEVFALGSGSGRGLVCTFADEDTWENFDEAFNHMRQSFTIETSLDE